MPDVEIISERPLALVELKEKLEQIEKRDDKLGVRATKTKDYLAAITKHSPKDTEELKKKILTLNVPRLKERHIVKIIDIMPKNIESLKMLFTGENITIKQEDIKRIFDVIKC